jgi:hypothetical protein
MVCWLHAELLQAQQTSFRPGEPWSDTNNEPINAHGVGVLYCQGRITFLGDKERKNLACGRSGVGMLPRAVENRTTNIVVKKVSPILAVAVEE